MSFWDDIEFFSKKEFDCKCGCGTNRMSESFIRGLDTMRRHLGFPLIVTSGYRCPEYNNKIASTGLTGPHTTGRAADLSVMGYQAHTVLRYATIHGGYSGIGIKQHGPHASRFIHLDDLEANGGRFRPTLWSYS